MKLQNLRFIIVLQNLRNLQHLQNLEHAFWSMKEKFMHKENKRSMV